MIKRILALLLAAALLIVTGCSKKEDNAPAESASDGQQTVQGGDEDPTGNEVDISKAGIIFTVPKEYAEAAGVMFFDADAIDHERGIYYATVGYIGMPEDEYVRIGNDPDASDDDIMRLMDSLRQPALIICAAQERTQDEIIKAVSEYNKTELKPEDLDNIGSNEGYVYYLIADKDTSKDAELGELAAEYRALCDRDLTVSCIRFVKPDTALYDKSNGRKLSFETTDVNGNKVTSEEIFSKNKVTMVNIWASWCGPCVNELPELEKLSKQFADKGCAIIGVLSDGDDGSGLADGLDIMKDTGITYPVILPWKSFENDLPYEAYPTTYFVDSSGYVLNVDPIVGAYVDEYPKALEEALKLVQ